MIPKIEFNKLKIHGREDFERDKVTGKESGLKNEEWISTNFLFGSNYSYLHKIHVTVFQSEVFALLMASEPAMEVTTKSDKKSVLLLFFLPLWPQAGLWM